jgi:uncharacterized protein DUF6338
VLTTAVAILSAIALLLPGFIVAEVAIARGARSSRSDLELALRALSYALVIHLLFGWWTADLVQRVESINNWDNHVGALSLYAVVVLFFVPVILGVALNSGLARIERRDGPPPLWAAALGAGQARDAYDFAFQRVSDQGAWVIVELVGHTATEPRLIGGRYGRASAVGQTPSAHDLYLEQLCLVEERADGLRHLSMATDPPRGVYIAATHIARLEVLPPGPDTMEP